MEAKQRLIKTRSDLIMVEPFWGLLALKLALRMDNNGCNTAATDGTYLYYNENFINKLSPAENKGLMAHEISHNVLKHTTRRGDRDPILWNISCDIPINEMLKEAGFVLPEGGLFDTKKEFQNMNAEQIYSRLLEKKENGEGWEGYDTPCPWGEVRDASSNKDPDSRSPAQVESDWEISTAQAAEVAKQAGKLPGDLSRFLDEMLEPLVDWRMIIWPFASLLSKDEFSWHRPNRAYISEDEYFPSLRDEALGTIALVMDSSGSTHSVVGQFMSEFREIKEAIQPQKLIILHCDTAVHKIFEIDKEDPIEKKHFNLGGGGGTSFSPAFRYIKENCNDDIEALIYLTDLECDDFGPEPPYPVVWVSSRRGKVPWGEIGYIFKE